MNIQSPFTLAVLLAFATTLSAQPHPPQGMGPQGPGPMALLKHLDLTEAQKKSIHTILEKHRAPQMAAHQTCATKEKAMRDAMLDPSSTEAQLRTLHTDVSESRFQILLEDHATLLEIQALLTPEQQAKAKSLHEKIQKKEEEAHRAGMESMGAGSEGPDAPPRP